MSDKKFKIIVILIIIFFVVFIFKFNRLEIKIENANRNASNMYNHIDNTIKSSKAEVRRYLKEKEQLIKKFEYGISDVDIELEKATIDILLELKSKQRNEKIYLYVMDSNNKKVQEILLKENMPLCFNQSIILDINKNYIFNIISKSEKEVKYLNNRSDRLYLKNRVYDDRVRVDVLEYKCSSKGDIYLKANIVNNYYNKEELKIKNIFIKVRYNGKEIYKEDIINNDKEISEGKKVSFKTYENISIREIKKIEEENNNNLKEEKYVRYFYFDNEKFKQKYGTKLNLKEIDNLEIDLIAVNNKNEEYIKPLKR